MTDGARTELASLAHALARTARRRRALGHRRVPAGAPPPAPAGGAPPDPAPARAGQSRIETHRATPAAPVAPADGPARPEEGPDGLRRRAAAAADLEALRAEVARCEACKLCGTRTQTVFQDGAGGRGVLFVGEAPGFHEDRQGVPFVGPAGRLLTDIVTKGMGLDRARDVSIANVLKCRPPDNRDPLPAEKALCTVWLDRQIELLDPKLIVALGRHAAGHLLRTDSSLGRLRGRVHDRDGRPVVVTYHPAYLLRNPADKRACWQDVQLAMRTAGLPLPRRGR